MRVDGRRRGGRVQLRKRGASGSADLRQIPAPTAKQQLDGPLVLLPPYPHPFLTARFLICTDSSFRLLSSPAAVSTMSAGGPVTVELTRQQKADALRSVKELLLNVGTNWAYTPAPIPLSVLQPTAPEGLSRGLSLRSAALGSWRPSEGAGIDTLAEEARRSKAHAAAAKEDDSWEEEPGSDSGGGDSDDTLSLGDSDEDADGGRGLSYRRPEMGIGASTVSKGKRKRRLRRMVPKRRGEWRVREDDSDYCLDGAADGSTAGAGGGTGGFRWEGPESVDDGEAQRRKEEEQNPGLKVWRERRQQWTGARGEWVPVGESRFKDVSGTPYGIFSALLTCTR